MLVDSTSANAVSPGDILKLMSIPDNSNATSNKNQTAFSSDLILNSKTYRKCSQHVTYYVTRSSRSSQRSLVDRGDNSGIAGSEVRVIETYPEHKVEIRGIDKH